MCGSWQTVQHTNRWDISLSIGFDRNQKRTHERRRDLQCIYRSAYSLLIASFGFSAFYIINDLVTFFMFSDPATGHPTPEYKRIHCIVRSASMRFDPDVVMWCVERLKRKVSLKELNHNQAQAYDICFLCRNSTWRCIWFGFGINFHRRCGGIIKFAR